MLLGQFATSAPLSISYTIDDGTPTNATLVYQRPGLSGPSAVENASVLDQLNVPLLDTGVLKAGAHSVELHLQPAETGSQPPLIVDYILYQPSFDSIASMPDVTRLLNSPRAKVDAAGGKTTPVGAIVGGVFGCLGAVILLTLSFCLWRRRRSQRGRLHSVGEHSSYTQVIQTYLLTNVPHRSTITDTIPRSKPGSPVFLLFDNYGRSFASFAQRDYPWEPKSIEQRPRRERGSGDDGAALGPVRPL